MSPVAPALAAMTRPIAATSRAARSWPSTRKPDSAATAGSSDIRTPKAAGGNRRSASIVASESPVPNATTYQ